MKVIIVAIMLNFCWVQAEISEEELLEAPPETMAADAMILQTAQNKKCDFTIDCQLGELGYSFEYKSLGENCAAISPGQLIYLTQNKRIPLDIKGSTFKSFEDLGPSAKVCEIKGKKYPSLALDDHKLALFLRIDGRPSYDKLGVLVIDLKKNKVVRLNKDLGEIKTTFFAFLKTDKGLKTRLIKEYNKSINCDCDAAFIEDWKEILVSTDEIKSKWIKPKP